MGSDADTEGTAPKVGNWKAVGYVFFGWGGAKRTFSKFILTLPFNFSKRFATHVSHTVHFALLDTGLLDTPLYWSK